MSPIQRNAIAEALQARLEALSPEKRALAEQHLREAQIETAPTQRVPRRPDGEAQPLSLAQALIWQGEAVAPKSAANNVARAMYVRGRIDSIRLRRALDRVAERHAVLRTNVAGEGDHPRLEIAPPRSVPMMLLDLRGAPATSRMNRLQGALRDQAAIPFDLANDLLLRAALVTMAPDEYAFLLVSHRIACDESSLGILLRDIDAAYRETADASKPLSIQYADFAHWQRGELTDERVAGVVDYWRARLDGAPSGIDLPTELPKQSVPILAGSRSSIWLTRDLADAIRKTARVHGTTSVIVLLATLDVLLYRYTNRADILVGILASGRANSELDGLAGCFTNTLPLRVSLDGDLTFTELLFRVRDASLEAGQYGDVPHERLAAALAPGRRGLFNVMFSMLDDEPAQAMLGGASLASIALDRAVAAFDMTVTPVFAEDGLRIGIEYRTDLIDAPTIERMLAHFATLLAEATSAPQTKIGQLPLMPASERELVVQSWNATETDYPSTDTLVSLMDAQVLRSPKAVAVALAPREELAGPSTLTFAELDARSTTLARALVARGVKPGILVAVCMDRSLELATAMAAVLRAGGAFVPIDPAWDAERIEHTLADARCPVLLTQRDVEEVRLASLKSDDSANSVEVLALDRDWAAIVSSASTLFEPMPDVGPDDLAYVLYANDSATAEGAVVRHRGVVNEITWTKERCHVGDGDSVLCHSTLGDGAFVTEVLLPLTAGARIVITHPARTDAAHLGEVIAAHDVSLARLPVTALAELLDAPAAAPCFTTLRNVVCTGEPLSYDIQQRYFSASGMDGLDAPAGGLHSHLDVVECGGPVASWTCLPDDVRRDAPIGRPVANTQLYVLDGLMQPVPIGIPGELYVGGVQVGAGYWDRTDDTTGRFVPDELTPESEGRLYRTGMIVRWLGDGVIERVATPTS